MSLTLILMLKNFQYVSSYGNDKKKQGCKIRGNPQRAFSYHDHEKHSKQVEYTNYSYNQPFIKGQMRGLLSWSSSIYSSLSIEAF